MVCPNCGTVHSLSDNFCRRCGWNLSGANVPAVIEERERSLVPYDAERALALGSVATFAVGALAWLAKRWLARRLSEPSARSLPAVVRRTETPLRRAERPATQPSEHTREQTRVESYIWIRRIWTWRREGD